ncbi:unnamed protein product [Polarella glacialis]|uniref:J domain-containing protein n=1 Tax=Polarella glacialis TaxID=89957 RepID=A0A813E8K1_POLGL|nr:unnamed protein product [Polarella glacialis]
MASCSVPGKLDADGVTARGIISEALRRRLGPQLVRELLEALDPGARTYALLGKDSDGHTLLHVAAMVPPIAPQVFDEVFHCLHEFRAELEVRNLLGETPLRLAVRVSLDQLSHDGGELCVVHSLLNSRADANAADELNGETPLMEAACRGSKAMCRLLLEFSAEPSKVTRGGTTAADFANCEGHSEVVQLLLNALPNHVTSPASASRSVPKPDNRLSGLPEEVVPPESLFATAAGFSSWAQEVPGTSASRGSLARPHVSWAGDFPFQLRGGALGKHPGEPTFSKLSNASAAGCGSVWTSSRPGTAFSRKPSDIGKLFCGYSPTFPGPGGSQPFGRPGSRGLSSGSSEATGRGSRDWSRPTAPSSAQRADLQVADHYRTLGVAPDAHPEEVRLAYRKLVLQYHPDKNQGSLEASEKFREVQAAYEAVSEEFGRN